MEQIIYSKFNPDNFDINNTLVVIDEFIVKSTNLGRLKYLILKGGEAVKSFDTLELICRSLIENNIDKTGTLISIGGGSIGDVAGLAADIYLRGINLVNVPTTLLSMIDSSIGGKNAINLNNIKNAAGTINQAQSVIIDLSYINSVTLVNLAIGELIKYSLLSKKIFDLNYVIIQLREGNFENLSMIIEKCIYFKQSIVEHDLLGDGIRKTLNLGHTIGHAIELNYNISHGQAVLAGLYIEALLGVNLGITDKDVVDYIYKYYSKFSWDKLNVFEIADKCTYDKKNSNKLINFQLIDKQFKVKEVNISKLTLTNILNDIVIEGKC